MHKKDSFDVYSVYEARLEHNRDSLETELVPPTTSEQYESTKTTEQ